MRFFGLRYSAVFRRIANLQTDFRSINQFVDMPFLVAKFLFAILLINEYKNGEFVKNFDKFIFVGG